MEQSKSLEALVRLELRQESKPQSGGLNGSLDKAIEWTRREMRKAAQGTTAKSVKFKKSKHA